MKAEYETLDRSFSSLKQQYLDLQEKQDQLALGFEIPQPVQADEELTDKFLEERDQMRDEMERLRTENKALRTANESVADKLGDAIDRVGGIMAKVA